MLPPELLLLAQICTKSFVGWGFAPDPTGGAYSAPTDPLAGLRGHTYKGRGGKGRGGKGREGKGKGGKGREEEGRGKGGREGVYPPKDISGYALALTCLKTKKTYSQSLTVKKRSNFTPDNLFLKTLIEGDFTMSSIISYQL